MDPYTATRAEFTQGMLNNPMPGSSVETSSQWRALILESKELFRLLGAHTAMRPNNQQTYMTPARLKSKNFAYRVPPSLRDLGSDEQEPWNDAVSRTILTASLILDTIPGRLDALVDSAYPGQTGELPFGQRPVMSEEIKAVARRLDSLF